MKQTKPTISAIVVGWMSADCIERCLTSLQASTVPLDIIVVDNHSPDATGEKAKTFKDITYVDSGDNIGYAGGINVGLAIAEQHQAAYSFVINPDAYIAPDCVEKLLDVMEKDPKIGMASPKIYYADSDKIWFAGATLDLNKGISPHIGQGQSDGPAFAKNQDIVRSSGCAMLVRMSAVAKIGYMYDEYFLYFEEVDWSLQFAKRGYRIVFVADSHCWHAASSSTGGFFTPLYQYYNTRNSLRLFRRFGQGSWTAFVLRHLLSSFKRLYNVLRNRPRNTYKVLRGIILGYKDYALGRLGRRYTF